MLKSVLLLLVLPAVLATPALAQRYDDYDERDDYRYEEEPTVYWDEAPAELQPRDGRHCAASS
jgi:hypothetical protein